MNHLPFTISAYLLNATSTTVDKFLLTKNIPHPLVYVFYLSIFSLLGLLPMPLTHIPPFMALFLGSLAVILWTMGAYFMFAALKVGLVTRVIPIIGTLIPLLLLGNALVTNSITTLEVFAVVLLTLGLVFLTIMDWKGNILKKELALIFTSAVLFTVSYIILREAYLQDNFLSVFVWSRFAVVPLLLIIILRPVWRRIVFSGENGKPAFKLFSKPGFLMMSGQAAGGGAELLLMFSISLANPALVNSLQGTQYAFLFIFSLILARRFPDVYQERFTPPIILSKVAGIALITTGLFLLAK